MNRFRRAIVVFALLGGILAAGLPGFAVPPAPHAAPGWQEVPDGVGNTSLHTGVRSRAVRVIGESVPLSGTVKLLAIPVEFFSDSSSFTSGTGTFPYKTWGPAAQPGYLQSRLSKISQYFAEVSGNRVNLQCTLTRVVRLSGSMPFYQINVNSTTTDANVLYGPDDAMMEEVVYNIDGEVNFAGYDIIMLIHAGAGQEMGGMAGDIWSHVVPGRKIYTNDAATIASWAVVPETECNDTIFKDANPGIAMQFYERDPSTETGVFIPHYHDVIGVWTHELGHCFGLADLYDVGYNGGLSLHHWSLMAAGSYLPGLEDSEWDYSSVAYDPNRDYFGSVPSHLDAWSKQYLGWTSVINVTGRRLNQQILPQAASSGVVYRLWTNGEYTSREYFLVENRTKVGQDRYLPESGLMIYHIDDTVGTVAQNNVQVTGLRPRVYPLSSDNYLETLYRVWSPTRITSYSATILETAFPGTARITHVGALTTPASVNWAGQQTYVDINNIRQVGTSIYADMQTASPTTVTFTNPAEGSVLYVSRPTIRCSAPNLDPINLTVTLNGSIIIGPGLGNIGPYYNTETGALTIPLDGTAGGPLQVGDYQLVVSGQDLLNAVMVTGTLNFTVREKTLTTDLQMISFPAINIGTVASVFTGQPTFELARWHATEKKYKVYPDPYADFAGSDGAVIDRDDPSKMLAPAGKAFWVRKLSATTALRMPGDLLLNKQQYILTTVAGFNMIGNPYTYSVAFGTLLVEYQGRIYSMAEAVTAKIIDPVLYEWGGSDRGYLVTVLPNGVLDPWKGYWVHCLAGTTASPLKLIFQPAATLRTRTVAGPMRVRGTTSNWDCTLKATATGLGAATVTVGVQPAATAGIDPGVDLWAPPTAPGAVALSSVSRAGGLLRDYRVGDSQPQRWELDVAAPAGTRVQLSWPDLTHLPTDAVAILTDGVSGAECYLRTSTAYTVTLGAAETSRRLTVTVAPARAGGLQVQAVSARRVRSNGGALISCQLTQGAAVVVDIRTATGVLVRRLDAGTRAVGAVLVSWDGRDASGRVVPRGIYQCQVVAMASNGQTVKAMTVLPPL